MINSISAADKRRMKSLITESIQTGRELGYIRCEDGRVVQVEGEGHDIELRGICDNPALVFHTHPDVSHNGFAAYFSVDDLRNAAELDRKLSAIGFIDDRGGPAVKTVHRENIREDTLSDYLIATAIADPTRAKEALDRLEFELAARTFTL